MPGVCCSRTIGQELAWQTEVHDHALAFGRTPSGVKVGRERDDRLFKPTVGAENAI
jgi:hypothetical protein